MTNKESIVPHEMWVSINNEFLNDGKFNLANFRMPGEVNSKLASWEPKENSLRWYRTFLNLAFNSGSSELKDLLSDMKGSISLGNPVTGFTIYQDDLIEYNLDYILALEEFIWLRKNLEINSFKSVLEIGAGFGRTAHSLLQNISELEHYYILDLPEMISVSKSYLKEVLDTNLFNKIEFVDEVGELGIQNFDLGIQIDGLQEMPEQVVNLFYDQLIPRFNYFYQKNPVAKYLPKHAGIVIDDNLVPFDLGRSKNVSDIWNLSEINDCFSSHAEVYRPINFATLVTESDRLFPHYLHVLYQRNKI